MIETDETITACGHQRYGMYFDEKQQPLLAIQKKRPMIFVGILGYPRDSIMCLT